ncbi:MAG: M14 family metallopeptidase [Acidobacteriota bacterium]
MIQRNRRTACALLLVAGLLVFPVALVPLTAQAPAAGSAATRSWPQTRPEATGYAETSRYDEVIGFMKAMAAVAPQIHLTTYGYSFEGRPMPLAVIGAPDPTPEQVLATGKTRVFIQGNIHAGEVEGKEALLWILRSVAKGERADWEKNVVLLINPIYNADGNERVSLRNRGSQNGPVGGMGQRHNAQDLDLNRDNTKLETAEARSLARLLTRYDPHIAVDLHTTNGSDHGFYLTYETSINPNTSNLIRALVHDRLLPSVTSAIKAKHGWDYFYYGGVSRQGERAWRGDAELYKPRYTQTYFGIRNRIGILSETYSYASFEDRIKSNYWFVEEIVNFAVQNGQAIRRTTAAADAESIVGQPQAVRIRLAKYPDPVTVVLADVVDERNPYVPDRPIRVRVTGSERTEVMPHYGMVETTETSIAPRAWVISSAPAAVPPSGAQAVPRAAIAGAQPPQGPPGGGRGGGGSGVGQFMGRGFGGGNPTTRMIATVVDRLDAHGIAYYRTTGEQAIKAERFRIESSRTEEREYQGTHKLRTLTGAWEPSELTIPAGSLVVPMDQPLARLAFVLFDPRSDDGLMAWNLLDAVLGTSPGPEFYPVLRTMEVLQRH